MKCRIDWCTEEVAIRYWCIPHYGQQRHDNKNTTHRRILTKIETPKEYFERIKELTPAPYPELNDCWIWPFSLKRRYPDFQYKGVRRNVHQWSYILYKGPIPEGLYVLHSCDVTRCFNPEHLRLGTQQDNMNDRFSKGR